MSYLLLVGPDLELAVAGNLSYALSFLRLLLAKCSVRKAC